jgi:pimeloyl-ACP methyl ester carboxylesterase
MEFVQAAGGQLTRRAVRRLAFGSYDVSETLIDFMIDMLQTAPVHQLASFVGTLNSHYRYDALPGLRETQVLVVGADADRITPFAHTERMVADLPNAKFVRIRGAGHMVQLEQPELLNSHLIDFIQQGFESAHSNGCGE